MPTKFAIALVAVLALFLVLRSGDESTPSGHASRPVHHGLERFDSVLQQGLSQDTQNRIRDGLSDSVSQSAKFLGVAEASVAELSE